MLLAALILAGATSCKRRLPSPTPRELAFEPSLTWTRDPPSLTITWQKNPQDTKDIDVYRKTPEEPTFTLIQNDLPPTTTRYVDTSVERGRVYEYYIERSHPHDPWQSGTYVVTGIEVPLIDARGRVILVIERGVAGPLARELARLEDDLVGDGYRISRIEVSAADTPPRVKAAIESIYRKDPKGTAALFLLGHVPVPYAGNIAPDGHVDPAIGPVHRGAWAADLYYADLHTAFTDESVDTRQNPYPPADPVNVNVPGDGKFDQARAGPADIPLGRGEKRLAPESHGSVDLALGRVDFRDMPAFAPHSELDLLRRYLDKDHAYRHKRLTAEPRALVDDHFGFVPSPNPRRPADARASFAYDSFAALVGKAAIDEEPWFDRLEQRRYFFAYGAGPGQHNSSKGIGTTDDIARRDPKVLFALLFGSYYGDYDHRDNFLRAQLATSLGLGALWGSHPFYLQPSALGQSVGYAARLSQNQAPLLHRAWLGDPTLRLQIMAPPHDLRAEAAPAEITLRWDAPAEPVAGYLVYRAKERLGPYERLVKEPIAGTSFVDAHPPKGETRYMIRAQRLEVTPSGSFENASQGIFVDVQPLP